MRKIATSVIFLFLISFFFACKTTNLPNEKTIITQNNSKIESGKLENGMSFYLMKNDVPKNKVYISLLVKAGSVLEDENQIGAAHFIEHLAYCGTANFSKQKILSFFDSLECGYGPDVNSYTSFEETVYNLELPSNDEKLLKTSLLLLSDFASNVSFLNADIENERKKILAEWDEFNKNDLKLSEKQANLLLEGSRFEKRLPLANQNAIKNISKKNLVDFYKKWYVAQNMSIIVVGDIDVQNVKKTVNDVFKNVSSSYNEEVINNKSFDVLEIKNKKLCVLNEKSDKTIANVYFRQKDFNQNDLQSVFVKQVAYSVLNERFTNLYSDKKTSLIIAEIGDYYFTNKTLYGFLGFVSKKGEFLKAFENVLEEYNNFCKNGASSQEFEKYKNIFLEQVEKESREKKSSNQYLKSIMQYELSGKNFVDEKELYKAYKNIILKMSLKDFNESVKSMLCSSGEAMFVISSSNEKNFPSEKEIMSLWNGK